MIKKLNELKQRAQNLQYDDRNELDDIIRKTKLYLGEMFPMKFHYPAEVDLIQYKPSISISGLDKSFYTKAWEEGKQSLVNLIDTRIEEYELISSQHKTKVEKPIVKEKIIRVEDTSKIKKLTTELENCNSKKKLWERVNWAILLTFIGGTFFFGKYVGENRFDQSKINLSDDNNRLIKENNHLKDSINQLKIHAEKNLLSDSQDKNVDSSNPLIIEVSFFKPLSIFDGKVLIQAKDELGKKLIFQGIKGLDKTVDGNYTIKEIEISSGDRFFIKLENDELWIANVIDTTIHVDLELVKR